MLGVGESRFQNPAVRNLRRRGHRSPVHDLEDVAKAALVLNDLFGVEERMLARGDFRAGGEDPANLLRALAGDVRVARVQQADVSVHLAGVTAMRDLGLRVVRVERQLVAALAVVLKAERARVHGFFRFDELVALHALQVLAPSLSVGHSAWLEVEGMIEA